MGKLTEISDNNLVSLYKENGNKEIIGELYKRYTQFVFLVSMKYLKNEAESKDSVMQIFEKLFKDLQNHKVDNFKSWLYMVTRNHCLMFLRKQQTILKNRQELKKDSENFMENDMNSHLMGNDIEEKKIETIQDAVSQLNKEQQECVKLFYIEGKSYSEIEKITNYSLKKVKSYIQNGKRNLKNILTKAGISAIILIFILLAQ
ncbi:MAG: sigma-70 family RNA polymerase sigma factor [Bacteroidales bacterium]|nr:sigma-70 family RNA polymerase sigma factor [Bacteroidales bacterium]